MSQWWSLSTNEEYLKSNMSRRDLQSIAQAIFTLVGVLTDQTYFSGSVYGRAIFLITLQVPYYGSFNLALFLLPYWSLKRDIFMTVVSLLGNLLAEHMFVADYSLTIYGFQPLVLSLGPWTFGFEPWRLGLVISVLVLGPWVFGLEP